MTLMITRFRVNNFRNLLNVEFRPEGFYYPAGGPSVYHIARPGEVTLARLTRSGNMPRHAGHGKRWNRQRHSGLSPLQKRLRSSSLAIAARQLKS